MFPNCLISGIAPLTPEEKKQFTDADVSGKQQILLDSATSADKAAMYVDTLCGDVECKGVVNAQVANKIGTRPKTLEICPRLSLSLMS